MRELPLNEVESVSGGDGLTIIVGTLGSAGAAAAAIGAGVAIAPVVGAYLFGMWLGDTLFN